MELMKRLSRESFVLLSKITYASIWLLSTFFHWGPWGEVVFSVRVIMTSVVSEKRKFHLARAIQLLLLGSLLNSFPVYKLCVFYLFVATNDHFYEHVTTLAPFRRLIDRTLYSSADEVELASLLSFVCICIGLYLCHLTSLQTW